MLNNLSIGTGDCGAGCIVSEVILGALLCGFLSGSEGEVRHTFVNLDEPRRIRIDCLTERYAFEFGLDKRSARDSVHQAVFAAELGNSEPFVVLIDTDGVEGRYEQEMRVVTGILDIPYATCSAAFIERWAATAPFRQIGLDKNLDDLPRLANFAAGCDLVRALEQD